MDLSLLERIKRLAIIAMVSDDELMEVLVLKGGNAIDLIYKLSGRASVDLDFSMQRGFKREELDKVKVNVEKALINTFAQEGMKVFDIKIVKKPSKIAKEYEDFWGGYEIQFKVVPEKFYSENAGNVDSLRRNATVVGFNQERIFKIDISEFEYCADKSQSEIAGYAVYVYTPRMIVLEKIRSICQQIPEYKETVKTHSPVARARDFFDIFIVFSAFPFDLKSEEALSLLNLVFEAKRVPLSFIKKIENQREFHRTDFASVKDTIRSGVDLKEFDFYFDYVVDLLKSIKC